MSPGRNPVVVVAGALLRVDTWRASNMDDIVALSIAVPASSEPYTRSSRIDGWELRLAADEVHELIALLTKAVTP